MASYANWRQLKNEFDGLEAEKKHLESSLNRELYLQIKDRLPGLGECNRFILALTEWRKTSGSWKRFFAGKIKKVVLEALWPFSLALSGDNMEKVREFYVALKARHLFSDLRSRILGVEEKQLPPDQMLLAFKNAFPDFAGVLEVAEQPVNASVHDYVISSLGNLAEFAPGFSANLRLSSKRAKVIQELETVFLQTEIFLPENVQSLSLQ